MNKIKLITILQELISLYLNNNLTKDTYLNLVSNKQIPILEDNILTIKETHFISFLFSNIPYYLISNTLTELIQILTYYSEDNHLLKATTLLLKSYLEDLSTSINYRLQEEIYTHLHQLLLFFYQHSYLDPKMTINSLLTNYLNPDQIASYEVACNYYYEQLTFTWFKEDNKSLKEEISIANYNKSYNIETYLKRLITKYYTKSSLDNFINELLLILKEYESINHEYSIFIQKLLINALNDLKIALNNKSNKRKKELIDPDQLTLNLIS